MIKVLIADDMEPICRRYRRILQTDPEIEVPVWMPPLKF